MGLLKSNSRTPDAGPVPVAAAGLDALVVSLGAEDPADRRAAARALGRHPAAVASLEGALATETDRPVQQALVGALAAIGTPAAVTALVAALRSPSAAARSLGLEALAELGGVAVTALHAQLHDPDPHVRISAIVSLAALPDVATESLLLHVLSDEGDANVLAAAVETLAQVGTGASVAALEALVLRCPDEPFLVFASRTVIQSIGGAAG